MDELIEKAYVNELNKNELVLQHTDGSGLVITVFDPTGTHGAENFVGLFEHFEGEISYETPIACQQIFEKIESSKQFSLMNVSSHSHLSFVLNTHSALDKKHH